MSTELIPFDESTDLVVGNYYNVRCAEFKIGRKKFCVPLLGPEHKDVQFGFKYSHTHIDGRFTMGKDGTTGKYDTGPTGYTPAVVSDEFLLPHNTSITSVVRRMKCRRLTTGLLSPHVVPPVKGWKEWYANYIGKSCKGRKCPHYGTHMLEVNGSLLCPLHHLKGDIETETIIAF